MSLRAFLSIAIAFGPVLIGCSKSGGGGSTGSSPKASSPEQALMIVQEAADKTDWGTVYDCMTEGLQKRYALGFLITLDPEMNAGSPWRDKCQSVLVRHGLGAEDQNNRKRSRDPNEDIELLADSIKDRRGLFVDALNLIVEMDDESKIEPFLFPGELTNVSIDGDVATATRKWKIGDRERPSAMSFKKVNGSWFLD